MEISQIMLSPADAARLLERNTINRKLSRVRAAGFTAICNRGEWQFDANPIKIAEDGTVLDGQHRLRGIAGSAVESVPVLLVTGLSAAARAAVDCGKARTFADYLDIESVPNSMTMAAAVRGVWNYEHGLFDWHDDWFERPQPSISQLWGFYRERRPELEDAVSQANRVIRHVFVARSPVAIAWVVLGGVKCLKCAPAEEDREDFFAQLRWVQEDPRPSEAVGAFMRLMNKRGRSEGKAGPVSYSQTEQLALLLKSWNLYREGARPKVLAWQRGGKTREKFPVPH